MFSHDRKNTSPKSSFLSLRWAIGLPIFSLLLGTIGYVLIENYSILDGLYMSVITFSTVGFKEVAPLSEAGQIFTTGFIILNILVLSYMLSAFTYYVIEGQIFHLLNLKNMEKEINQMQDHIIICGYSSYGREIVHYLLEHDRRFIVIDKEPEPLIALREKEPKLLFINGDATKDETLNKAGINRANALITTLPEDADNLFVVLSARQLNADLSIISRAKDRASKKKLILSGADHTIMPEQIGGFYMANLVRKPHSTQFFTFLSDELDNNIVFAETKLLDLDITQDKIKLRELNLRKYAGVYVIAIKNQGDIYTVNPGPEQTVDQNSTLILLGTYKQMKCLENNYGLDLDLIKSLPDRNYKEFI
ncbi:MAG: potassium channel protein [Bacteroidetes bacterium]|jgi:voltage-gated potassium channel|nr:potassium channel protein [Bacteroidota bacterium]